MAARAVVSVLLLLGLFGHASGQDVLSPELRELPPGEFVIRAQAVIEAAIDKGPLLAAVAAHSADLLRRPATLQQESYATLQQLANWGASQLTDAEKNAIEAATHERNSNTASASFETISQKIDFLQAVGIDANKLAGEVATWVNATPVEQLTPHETWWPLMKLRVPSVGFDEQNFSVRWHGFVKAPSTGPFVFSVPPFDTSFDHADMFVRQSIQVMIDGNVVIHATGGDWKSESAPVNVSADIRYPIQIDFSYHRQGGTWGDKNPAVLLYWEAPGMPRVVVR
jgi:hypothetical protein